MAEEKEKEGKEEGRGGDNVMEGRFLMENYSYNEFGKRDISKRH